MTESKALFFSNCYMINDKFSTTSTNLRNIKSAKNFPLTDDSSLFRMFSGADLFCMKICDSS